MLEEYFEQEFACPNTDGVFAFLENRLEDKPCGFSIKTDYYRLEVLDTFSLSTPFTFGEHVVWFHSPKTLPMFTMDEMIEFYNLFEGRLWFDQSRPDGSHILARWDSSEKRIDDLEMFQPLTSFLDLMQTKSVKITFKEEYQYLSREVAGPCFKFLFRLLERHVSVLPIQLQL